MISVKVNTTDFNKIGTLYLWHSLKRYKNAEPSTQGNFEIELFLI